MQKVTNKLFTMNLRNTVLSFRKGLLDGRPSDQMCFVVCWPLHGFLNTLGIACDLIEGNVKGVSSNHYWLKLPDGRIIDPTADQFNSDYYKMPKVYIGPKPEHYVEG